MSLLLLTIPMVSGGQLAEPSLAMLNVRTYEQDS